MAFAGRAFVLIWVTLKKRFFSSFPVDFIKSSYNAVDVQVTAPRSGRGQNVGLEAVIDSNKSKIKVCDVCKNLESLEQVVFAIESI